MIAERDLEALVACELSDPHRLLGAHPSEGGVVVRALRPDASAVHVVAEGGEPVELARRHAGGAVRGGDQRRGAAAALRAARRLPGRLGGHAARPVRLPADARRARPSPRRRGPPRGAAGAPRRARARARRASRASASRCGRRTRARSSVVGDFNGWDGRLHPMRSLGASGLWELFVPDVTEGSRYKFELHRTDGGPARAGRPVRRRGRASAAERVGRPALAPPLGRRGVDGRAPRARPARASRCRCTRSTSAPGA